VLVVWAWYVEIASADVIYGLVIDKEGAIRVLDRAVRRQDSIIWLNDRG
jgi:hypothetical protein